MTRYEVSGPDGARYEVTAPDGMSEADVLARFQQEVGGQAGSQAPSPSSGSQSWGDYLKGLGRAAVQGATFELGDELGLTDREAGKRFDEENPVMSTVARIVGGAPLFVAGPGAAAARWSVGAPSMLGKIWRSSALGGGLGTAAGLGAGEGDLANRWETSGQMGGLFGTAVGAAIPPVAAGAGALARGAGTVASAVAPQTTQRLRTAMLGGTRGEPPVRPVSDLPAQQPIEGASFIADPPAPPPAPPPTREALDAVESARQLLVDQAVRGGRTRADIDAMGARFAEMDRARTMNPNSFGQDVTALVDMSPEWRRLAGSIWRAYPESANDMNAFIDARQTGIAPRERARDLAQRGIPTRGSRFTDPRTRGELEEFGGTQFRTPAGKGVGNEDKPMPMGHLERVRDELRRSFEISDEVYHRHGATGVLTQEMIVNRAEAAARKNYADAFKAHETRNLRSIIGPVFRKHLDRARMEESTKTEAYIAAARALFLRKGPPGKGGPPVYLRQFDQVKRELDGMIKADLAKPERVHRGGVLNELRKDLLAAVDNATGGEASLYKTARAEFSSEMEMANAYLMGRKALDDTSRLRRTGPGNEVRGTEVTADAFDALSKGEQKLFRLGLLDAITAAARGKPRANEALRAFETPRVQELLSATIKRTDDVTGVFADRPERLSRFIDFERDMQATRETIRGNSMTARNLQDDLALAGLETVQRVQSFMDMFRASTSLWNFGHMVFQWIVDRSFGIRADAARELTRMLFTANPQERVRILAWVAERMPADRMARFNELMARVQQGVAPGISAGAGVGTPTPQSQQGPTLL
jgi:hypothetical protein